MSSFAYSAGAGLTVGMMLVPQGIAYASGIALLPPQYGLYASFVGLLVYAVLGTSRDLSVGPTSILALLVASDCAQVNNVTVIGDALFLAFFSGCIQLAMGLLRLGAPRCTRDRTHPGRVSGRLHLGAGHHGVYVVRRAHHRRRPAQGSAAADVRAR